MHAQTIADLQGRVAALEKLVATLLPNAAAARAGDAKITAAVAAGFQPLDATLTAMAGVATSADTIIYFFGVDQATSTPLTAQARLLLDDATDSDMRTTLNLGSMAVQFANGVAIIGGTMDNVSITGGSITGIVDLAVADGGTGASTAAGARTNLGLVIGTDVQAYDAELAALAGLTSAADRLPYFTGSGTAALATFTAAARTVLDDATVGDILTTIGGQPLDATLTALAGVTTSADKFIYATGSDTFTTATVTSYARTILDDADEATLKATINAEANVDFLAVASPVFTGVIAGPTGGGPSAPPYTFTGDTDNGWYRSAGNTQAWSCGNFASMTLDATTWTKITDSTTPDLIVQRTGTISAGNTVMRLRARGPDSGGTATDYVTLLATADVLTDGAERGGFAIQTLIAGANTTVATLGVLGLTISTGTTITAFGTTTVSTNADFTLTARSSTSTQLHTGTLTADRAVTLSTSGALAGDWFLITRTGAGAFNLNIGTGPLKALATNTWGLFMYTGSAWGLRAYGAL